jgi:hypothetical protein
VWQRRSSFEFFFPYSTAFFFFNFFSFATDTKRLISLVAEAREKSINIV